MEDTIPKEFLNFAYGLAAAAAGLVRSGGFPAGVRRKADDSVVTEMDHAVQRHLLGAIAATYPDHAVLAEEHVSEPNAHADPSTCRYCWVIDPVDGTRNYAVGLPCYSTSIALLDRSEPIVAVVMEHNLGRVFAAVRGGGAMLDNRPVSLTDRGDFGDLLVAIPSSKDRFAVRVIQEWVATKGLVTRNFGSTALHLALVSSGALDAAFSKRSKIWDVAAGVLLVEEAGGIVTDPVGRPLHPFDLTAESNLDLPFLAAHASRHGPLLESVRRAASGE